MNAMFKIVQFLHRAGLGAVIALSFVAYPVEKPLAQGGPLDFLRRSEPQRVPGSKSKSRCPLRRW